MSKPITEPSQELHQPFDWPAIVLAVVFLAVGFGATWIAAEFTEIEGEAVLVSLLLAPVLVYVIVSGKLEVLKGPGGLEAKFTKTARQPVSATSETVAPSVDDMDVLAKEGVTALERKREELSEAKPIVMTMTVGRRNYYSRPILLQYLDTLSRLRSFKFVVFIDDAGRFLAYMPAWAVKEVLGVDYLGDEFVNAVNEGRTHQLFRYPGVVTRTISVRSSNVEALRMMTEENLNALVVTGEGGKLEGIVERDQLVGRMMLSLTSA